MQPVDDGIESVPTNAIAAFDSAFASIFHKTFETFPDISDFSPRLGFADLGSAEIKIVVLTHETQANPPIS
jgi:hypothetical protein